MKFTRIAIVVSLFFGHQIAGAQALNWRVVSTNSAIVNTPGFPAGSTPNFFKYSLLDSGNQTVLGEIGNPPLSGRWVRRQGTFVKYAQVDVTGAPGPNRTGAEAGHVFRSLVFGDVRAGSDSNISIVGRAGAPGVSTSGLPNAVWRFDGAQNQEIMRASLDNNFGPNLGAGWFFADEAPTTYPQADGSTLIYTNIVSPTSFTRRGVVKNTPATGNSTCALIGSTLPALSPNIGNANPFLGISSIVTLDGTRSLMLASTQLGSAESGIWEICNGAPNVLALTTRSGSLGPNIGISTAVFIEINTNARNGGNGELLFAAAYRTAPGSTEFNRGFFRRKNGSNNLIAVRGDTGALGPNWLGSSFSTFENESLIGAGAHVGFEADVRTPDNTTVAGIFRIRPGGNPEPVALIGILGQFAPAAGQTFGRFDRWTMLANGDVIADCAVNNGPSGLYRFRIGQAPQLVMSVGQAIPVQTTSGLVQASVVSFDLPVVDDDSSQSSYSWGGYESWAATDGTLMVRATVNLNGTNTGVLLLSKVDVDVLLKDGFE
jgi:hypothetical protein